MDLCRGTSTSLEVEAPASAPPVRKPAQVGPRELLGAEASRPGVMLHHQRDATFRDLRGSFDDAVCLGDVGWPHPCMRLGVGELAVRLECERYPRSKPSASGSGAGPRTRAARTRKCASRSACGMAR